MAGPHVVDVSEASFDAEVLERSHQVPVVVDFWAEWCGPCRALGPVLEGLAAEDGGAWVLAKVDTDANQGLAQRYRIRGIPAVKAFVNGEVVDEFTGALPKAQVRGWLAGLGPSPAEPQLDIAYAALEAGNRPQARGALEAAVELDPDHPQAIQELAKLLVDDGDIDAFHRLQNALSPATREALEPTLATLAFRIGAQGRSIAEWTAAQAADPLSQDPRWGLAHAHAAAGAFPEALDTLLEIVRRDRRYRDDGARKAMLKIFAVVGERSAVADRYRRRLQMALF